MSEKKVRYITYEQEDKYEYIVAMGISTGGPKLLSKLVKDLDDKLDATYIVVQHMPPGFTKTLAERLDTMSALKVREAEDGDLLKRGVVYIAPGGRHLRITNTASPKIRITDEEPYKGHKPSVNIMLNSLVDLDTTQKKIITVIMTGMGNDGLEGISNLKKVKKCQVIAQDQATSTVYGMPKAIVNAGLADYVVASTHITEIIKKIVGDNYGS